MLWDIVYDFFTRYIFGGYLTDGSKVNSYIGSGSGGTPTQLELSDIVFTIGNRNLSLSNYLSLIATIISMVAIVLICCALIKKIYNMCAHIIG